MLFSSTNSCLLFIHSNPNRIVKKLILKSDVVIENFKPMTMEKWGLGPDIFKAEKPELIYCRVSGYGQTGPNAHKPGFASVCEAFGGFRYVTGYPNEPPVRPNISLGDSLAGMHAAFGILLALLSRIRHDGKGQTVDVAIYESVFNMMEAIGNVSSYHLSTALNNSGLYSSKVLAIESSSRI